MWGGFAVSCVDCALTHPSSHFCGLNRFIQEPGARSSALSDAALWRLPDSPASQGLAFVGACHRELDSLGGGPTDQVSRARRRGAPTPHGRPPGGTGPTTAGSTADAQGDIRRYSLHHASRENSLCRGLWPSARLDGIQDPPGDVPFMYKETGNSAHGIRRLATHTTTSAIPITSGQPDRHRRNSHLGLCCDTPAHQHRCGRHDWRALALLFPGLHRYRGSQLSGDEPAGAPSPRARATAVQRVLERVTRGVGSGRGQ